MKVRDNDVYAGTMLDTCVSVYILNRKVRRNFLSG